MLLEEALRRYFMSERAHKHQITAITHPLLVGSKNRYIMRKVLLYEAPIITIDRMYEQGNRRLFPVVDDDGGVQAECIIEIQHFLRDPRRARRCYVDSGMYADLSLQVARVIFGPLRSVLISSFLDLILLLISKVGIDYYEQQLEQSLQLAADTLPFYLENGDYTSELADYLLSHSTLDRRSLPKIYPNIQPLQDAVNFYLKVKFFFFLQYIRHINFTG
jgi:hypothetical protein